MKIPQKPPDYERLCTEARMAGRNHEITQRHWCAGHEDDYLHWDDLRRRTPPEGLTHEEWWLDMKRIRRNLEMPLPLHDKGGRPFLFSIPDSFARQLHEIDRNAGTVIGTADLLGSPRTRDRYIARSLVEEAITSSQLEGAATTREVAKEMLASHRKPRDKSEQMILNNYRTMQRIREIRDEQLSPATVLDLHRRATEHTLNDGEPGRLRRDDEAVRVYGPDGEILHDPPAASELKDRMEAMCLFANGGKAEPHFIHPVVRAMALHFWLAYDHPFVDGNGRTARALFYWAMLHQGYWLFEYISISEVLVRARAQYARAFLLVETDENDLTYFLLHQGDVIRKSLALLHAHLARRTTEQTVLMRVPGLNHRQRALLAHAIANPGMVYTVAGHRLRQNTAYDTARTDLLSLAASGFLEKQKQGREWIFISPRDLSRRMKQSG